MYIILYWPCGRLRMTTQKFQQNMAMLQTTLQKAVYKFIYSKNLQGALLSQVQEHIAKARVPVSEFQLAIRHLRNEKFVYIKQNHLIATLFNPETQNLDPWFESIDKIDTNYLDKLRRQTLEIVKTRKSPNIESIASVLRSSGVCRTDLTENQVQRIVNSLLHEQYICKIGDIYYLSGKNKIGEALACTACGECEYLEICDVKGLGMNCKWMEQWLSK